MPIKISNLTKVFQGETVLNIGDLPLETNNLTVLMGKNGSGKSTLLNCIGGLLRFETGEIAVDIPNSSVKYNLAFGDRSIKSNSRIGIGHIFQQKVLWNHFSVLNNIIHPLVKVRQLSFADARDRAIKYLKLLDIDLSLHEKYPYELSGGQQRKVAIARTLSMEPELLLIDELEANLDQSSLKLTMAIIKREYIDKHKTVLMISHSIELLDEFNPNIVVLHEGTVFANEKGITELLLRIYDDKCNGRIVKQSVDASSRRWFLANQSLHAVIKLSEINLAEKEINTLFIQIGKEVSKLIANFEPEEEHLLLIATNIAAPQLPAEVTVRCAEKSSGFILNGKEASKLNRLVREDAVRNGQTIYKFSENYLDLFKTGGFNLVKKSKVSSSEPNSLIEMMFRTNGENLEYQYTDRHPVIKGAYNISIPIPVEGHETEKQSYYEFSQTTKNVYLIGCTINNVVKGIISVDTTSEEKWSNFVIQQLILIGNMVAIAIKDHEPQIK